MSACHSYKELEEKLDDLTENKVSLEKEFEELLQKTSDSYYQYKLKNDELDKKLVEREDSISELTEKVNSLQGLIIQLKKDIKSSEAEKEEHTNHISQLIKMKKTYQEKVDKLKSELSKIEEVKILDLSTPKLYDKKQGKQE